MPTRSPFRSSRALLLSIVAWLIPALGAGSSVAAAGLDFEQLAGLRLAREVRISPDGSRVAYVVSVPRRPGDDDDGPEWRELRGVAVSGGESRAFVHGAVSVSTVRFTPDGKWMTYISKRGDDEHRSVWAIPVDGGESTRVLQFDSDVLDYRIAPDGRTLAFVAREPETKARKRARKNGYTQEVYEEDWRPRRLWLAPMTPLPPPVENPSSVGAESVEPRALPVQGSVYGLSWSPAGDRLALAVAPKPLVDHSYMFQRIQVWDVGEQRRLATIENPGKLGSFAFSPDGAHVAMISGEDPSDPAEGRLMLAPADGGSLSDLLPGLEGHVSAFAWRDADTVLFVADVGVETKLGQVAIGTAEPTYWTSSGAVSGGSHSPVLLGLSLSADGRQAALLGETPDHPREVFTISVGSSLPIRLTDSNPWLAEVDLGDQEVFRWKARDGMELEGILIHPLGGSPDGPPPLIVSVHGGPEAHARDGWNTYYSRPGQLAAGLGYAYFYPNYRGSTGRGVPFSKLGHGDAAGPEFDDLVDGVDALVKRGAADEKRVGIHGGSYGGYATAWCATRYADRFRAGVMFVGISNKLTKALTTDIPYEDQMVHTRYDPWTRFDYSLERSPLSYVEQATVPLLIAGGTADTRVHPSQSLQFYRALKMIGKTPVRYVRYPGEGHGNRRAASRDDYARRLMRWMDHFLVDGATDLPPWNLGLGEQRDEEEPCGDDEE